MIIPAGYYNVRVSFTNVKEELQVEYPGIVEIQSNDDYSSIKYRYRDRYEAIAKPGTMEIRFIPTDQDPYEYPYYS